jgi:mRNA-degrading endonuclease RelE of RelBE toxin-antitoxin system
MELCVSYSERFKKHYKKLNDNEKKQFKSKLKLFVKNPNHPSLRTKQIKGTDDLFEFSVNMDIRVIWFYENGALVVFIDIGHHNVLYDY